MSYTILEQQSLKMGRKNKFIRAVKKVFSPESKEKKAKEKKIQSNYRSSNKLGGIGQFKDSDPSSSVSFETDAVNVAATNNSHPQIVETEHINHAYAEEVEFETVAETSVSRAEAVDVVNQARYAGKSVEEIAAIKIQTAFRGYLARRALRALRGLGRLKSLVHSSACKRQTTTTLRYMQTLARVQSQIRSRRMRMSEENLALQRQLLLKREKELETLRMGDEWDDSIQSKEQTMTSLMKKQEACIRRERALAYAFAHQGKNASKSGNPMFIDPNNVQWGWSWVERWMSARPWEARTSTDKHSDHASIKSMSLSLHSSNLIAKSYANRDTLLNNKTSPKISKPLRSSNPEEDDIKSMISVKSEKNRRHSIAGSSNGDDESMGSMSSVPSYMASTKSAKARSRFSSSNSEAVVIEGIEKVGGGSVAKKKLTYPTAAAKIPRRHSDPPKVDLAKVKI